MKRLRRKELFISRLENKEDNNRNIEKEKQYYIKAISKKISTEKALKFGL